MTEVVNQMKIVKQMVFVVGIYLFLKGKDTKYRTIDFFILYMQCRDLPITRNFLYFTFFQRYLKTSVEFTTKHNNGIQSTYGQSEVCYFTFMMYFTML